jgi:hypothetical protein
VPVQAILKKSFRNIMGPGLLVNKNLKKIETIVIIWLIIRELEFQCLGVSVLTFLGYWHLASGRWLLAAGHRHLFLASCLWLSQKQETSSQGPDTRNLTPGFSSPPGRNPINLML